MPGLLPIWPRVGVAETLEWTTDVMVTEDGSEERTEMLDAPFQGFTMSFFLSWDLQARINNLLYGGRTAQWYIPVWSQVQHIGAVTAGLMALPAETRYSEFRPDSTIMLWQSPTEYQVLGLDSVASDTSLALAEATEAFTDAWLMPVRVGYLTQAPQRRFDGRSGSLDLNFAVEDNLELSPADPTQYLGLDLITDAGLLEGAQMAEQLTARFDLFDEGLGVVEYRAPWTNIRPARVHRMMAEGAAEAWAIREFLHRRRGRSVAFWLPTFENDLRLNDSGAKTTSIKVLPDDYVGNAEAREHIAIETTSGWLARRITSATVLGPTETQLILDSTLGGIQASTIKRISFLGQKRLDTDRVEIQHKGTNCEGDGVFACAVNVMEIAP